MSSKKEDLHIQLQDSVRKLEYMINDVIERFDFDQGATTDPEEAMVPPVAYNMIFFITSLSHALPPLHGH